MTLDLIPRSFLRFPAFWDEDEDWLPMTSGSSGLSVSEDDKHVYVEAAVPGLDPKDIEVTFHKGVLWIKGEAKEEKEDKARKYYRRAARSFSYQVAVPGVIDESVEPEAEYKDGIMAVTFKKQPTVAPKKLTVKKK